MEKNTGVRKGTWTKEEDILLTKCIEKFGEGRWHQVPARAGLNRCRKSCRLRWLNYLRPNIKRGYFTKDEVDLLVRLHKLLGNRWSLIAGRLPGRTANDVKNFWNTYIGKKPQVTGESCRGKTITKSNIIRPRPWTFSRLQVPPWPSELPRTTNPNKENPKNNNTSLTALSAKHPATNDENPTNRLPSASASFSIEGANDWTSGDENHKNKQPSSSPQEVDECIRWWGNLLEMAENGEGTSFLFSGEDPGITTKTMFSQGSHDYGSNSTIQDGLCSLTLDDVLEFVHLNGGQ